MPSPLCPPGEVHNSGNRYANVFPVPVGEAIIALVRFVVVFFLLPLDSPAVRIENADRCTDVGNGLLLACSRVANTERCALSRFIMMKERRL